MSNEFDLLNKRQYEMWQVCRAIFVRGMRIMEPHKQLSGRSTTWSKQQSNIVGISVDFPAVLHIRMTAVW